MASPRSSSNQRDRKRQSTSLAICREQPESAPARISTALILKMLPDPVSSKHFVSIFGANCGSFQHTSRGRIRARRRQVGLARFGKLVGMGAVREGGGPGPTQ